MQIKLIFTTKVSHLASFWKWDFLELGNGVFSTSSQHSALSRLVWWYYTENVMIISNGNRTEWSPIRSVIIPVSNKIGRPRSGSPICLITSIITDRIGRHEVLLPINHNFNKICNIIGYFLNQNTRNSKFCFASSEKKSHSSTRVMARTVQLLRDDAYCAI